MHLPQSKDRRVFIISIWFTRPCSLKCLAFFRRSCCGSSETLRKSKPWRKHVLSVSMPILNWLEFSIDFRLYVPWCDVSPVSSETYIRFFVRHPYTCWQNLRGSRLCWFSSRFACGGSFRVVRERVYAFTPSPWDCVVFLLILTNVSSSQPVFFSLFPLTRNSWCYPKGTFGAIHLLSLAETISCAIRCFVILLWRVCKSENYARFSSTWAPDASSLPSIWSLFNVSQ